MANRYSNQFAGSPTRAITAGVEVAAPVFSWAGSNSVTTGEAHRVVATYVTGAAAPLSVTTADALYICRLPPKAKVQRIHVACSADPASAALTVNIGYTGSLSAFVAASAGLAAGADTTIDIGALDLVASPTDWVDMILTPAANSLDQAATLTFTIDYVIEKP